MQIWIHARARVLMREDTICVSILTCVLTRRTVKKLRVGTFRRSSRSMSEIRGRVHRQQTSSDVDNVTAAHTHRQRMRPIFVSIMLVWCVDNITQHVEIAIENILLTSRTVKCLTEVDRMPWACGRGRLFGEDTQLLHVQHLVLLCASVSRLSSHALVVNSFLSWTFQRA